MVLIYDKEKCTGCMLCPKVCNFGAITKDGNKVRFDFDKCVLCGSCQEVCPVNAIKIERKAVDKDKIAQYKDVWVVCETAEGRVRSVAYELVTKARVLADNLREKVVAVLIGSDTSSYAESLIQQGADKVLVVDDKAFADYTTDAYTIAVTSLIAPRKPAIVLFGATGNGRDLAPRVAARLGLGLTADCTGLEIDDKRQLVQIRPAFGGNIMAEILCPYTRPQMSTVRPNVFKPRERDVSRKGTIEKVEVKINPVQIRTRVVNRVKELAEGMKPIDTADVIVCSGRGIKDPANLTLPTELAKLLDAAVGGSRPVVDAGWLPPSQQVGQSGRTVCPKLYFALGISGAIQHRIGMSSSDVIVAVNKDPEAPIFEIADFGIVGDLFEVVPAVIEELKNLQSER
ncbi:MAG: electron transfer flavoprotein subunit alpha [Candidatus Thorarchaeota archaeon]|nr:MAG: electron transfer flavoprotein subunit alpha [Candidatus Thorarchaeota archaeon]